MRKLTRREALARAATTGAALAGAAVARGAPPERVVKNGRLKQSVSRWPYRSIATPDFCRAVADMGLSAIDRVQERGWALA